MKYHVFSMVSFGTIAEWVVTEYTLEECRDRDVPSTPIARFPVSSRNRVDEQANRAREYCAFLNRQEEAIQAARAAVKLDELP